MNASDPAAPVNPTLSTIFRQLNYEGITEQCKPLEFIREDVIVSDPACNAHGGYR